MEKALIYSSGDIKETLSLALSALKIDVCSRESFDTDVLKDNFFDLIIIEQKICDISEILKLKKKTDSDILVIADEKLIEELSGKLSPVGIFVLNSKAKDWEIIQAVNFIKASNSRFDSLKKEKDGLKKKVEDMKIIDRAKCCLIQYLAISEATAHRHIEKQAMDMRCTKRKVAEEILKKYES